MADLVNTIAIGGSAGSLTALKTLLPALRPDIPAAILICQHVSSIASGRGSDLLRRHSPLEVVEARDRMPLRPGRIHVAAPDRHMMIGHDHIHLRRGAQENNFRPAIDPLFRSLAVYRATRAVGVVLSGLMDDGAAGARAIERTGGTILVEAPETAEFPDMPQAALRATEAARPLPLTGLAETLNALAGTPVAEAGPIPWEIGVEMKIAGLEEANMANEDRLGTLSPFNCPHCDGVLWEIEDGPMVRYRCHTGHAYSTAALALAQEEALDHQLFSTLRAHKGRAELLRRMSVRSGERSSEIIRERIRLIEEDTMRLEEIIRHRSAAVVDPPPAGSGG